MRKDIVLRNFHHYIQYSNFGMYSVQLSYVQGKDKYIIKLLIIDRIEHNRLIIYY